MRTAPRRLLFVFFVFIGSIALPGMVSGNGCINCHKDPIFRLHNHKLYVYYQDWLTSPHNEAGVTCNACHGGDPSATDKNSAHEGVLGPSDPKSSVFFKNQVNTCGTCHAEVAEQFTKSKHYQAVNRLEPGPNCSTCHRAMNKKPYYHIIVDDSCRTCHWKQAESDVSSQAEEILRRLNTSKGYMGWASLYYDSRKWPGDSKQKIQEFRARYHEILAKGHSFNLNDADRTSAALLVDLKKTFELAWKTCHKNKECGGIKPDAAVKQ